MAESFYHDWNKGEIRFSFCLSPTVRLRLGGVNQLLMKRAPVSSGRSFTGVLMLPHGSMQKAANSLGKPAAIIPRTRCSYGMILKACASDAACHSKWCSWCEPHVHNRHRP